MARDVSGNGYRLPVFATGWAKCSYCEANVRDSRKARATHRETCKEPVTPVQEVVK